ncbi:MAG: YpoC family protein [Sporolactobacillus sp.]
MIPSGKVRLPETFRFAPFYAKPTVISPEPADHGLFSAPFITDLIYWNDQTSASEWPWQRNENWFHLYWQKEKPGLSEAFHRRDLQTAGQPMLRAVAGLIDQLVWSSGQPVATLEPNQMIQGLIQFSYAPLNLEERLRYIMNQPNRYLAFIQLDQLEEELTKKLAVRARRT